MVQRHQLSQLINEPTQIQANITSCIDLIFTDQKNLSLSSGVHLSFTTPYPPPYQQLVWDYKKAISTTIRKALDTINWERLFHGKDINTQVTSFNDIILNVFKNYVTDKGAYIMYVGGGLRGFYKFFKKVS